jgi:cytochrome b561
MNEAAVAWPLVVRLIHWASAALVCAALACGVYMVQVVDDIGTRFELTQTHKSIGIAVLMLTLARLCLRMLTATPGPEAATPLLVATAKVVHASLYALLLAMAVSGWLMATSTPVRVPTVVFGLLSLPYPLSPDLPTYRLAHVIHVVCAISLVALVALHAGAALLHACLWRDRTLARMWRKQGLV